jgi:hypothetical protein
MDSVGGGLAFVLLAAAIVIVMWGLVDAVSHPPEAWEAAGQNRGLWIGLQAVGVVFCFVAWIVSLAYLLAVRPRVRAAEQTPPG